MEGDVIPSVRSHLQDFTPLIPTDAYGTKHMKGFRVGLGKLDFSSEFVFLHPISSELLDQLKRLTKEEKDGERGMSVGSGVTNPPLVEALKCSDIQRCALRSNNVIVATSFGLWGTVDHCGDIIDAVKARFLAGADERRMSKKVKLQLKHFFKFLNEMQVDVVVLSPDRTRVAVYSAVRSRSSFTPRTELSAAEATRRPGDGGRTLLALEFDHGDGSWCPLRLAPELEREKEEVGDNGEGNASPLPFIPEDTLLLDGCNASITHGASLTLGALGYDSPADSRANSRTVYKPQRVSDWKGYKDEVTESHEGSDTPEGKSPFEGMRYPNIRPLDIQFFDILLRGLNPRFRLNRIRLLVAFPVAILGAGFGVILTVYLRSAMGSCCRDASSNTCSGSADHNISDEYCEQTFCDDNNNTALAQVHTAFLFGNAPVPGHFVVGATCCMLLASVATLLVGYFTARSLAIKSRPLFHMVVMCVQILLAAAAAVLSAYTIFILSHSRHKIDCSFFGDGDALSCMMAQRFCPNYIIEVVRPGPWPVELVLSSVLFLLCVVELVAAFLPPMPSKEVVESCVKAIPETGTFYPSVYAPDGITSREKATMRCTMKKNLRMQLKTRASQKDILLTRNVTIGELIAANRDQSLKEKTERLSVPTHNSTTSHNNREVEQIHYMVYDAAD
ncbi:hypothetical protein DPX39_090057900 [Trypanosoma brucei equiperdum]|uniref:Uncharacterized protein n=1 Tax=Trypanosoma brucei equiperdum TaxID=630700 RepID=A0A3L6L3F5_9TRYP|nr:hypothetical protein DPX39_090057900 [Trypanosoma brucei equiperdum]